MEGTEKQRDIGHRGIKCTAYGKRKLKKQMKQSYLGNSFKNHLR